MCDCNLFFFLQEFLNKKMQDEDNVPPPLPQITECLIPQTSIKPNDPELIDLANSFDVKNASSPTELKNFADICLSARRAFGLQHSPGIEAIELKVLQCQMIINKKFPEFKENQAEENNTAMETEEELPTKMDEVHEEEDVTNIDFIEVKNTWLDRVEADAKYARSVK